MNVSTVAGSRYAGGFSIAILGALLLGPIGCASQPQLTLTSIDHHQSYRQGFTNAYTNRNSNGETDVILVDQAGEDAIEGKDNPASVRQMMHIHILWSPTSDMKAVVSNASVKWYVIGKSSPRNVLQYSGIAFVSTDDDENAPTLRVQNALLKPSGNHGNMNDPIGPSRLDGAFIAHVDPQKVERLMSQLKDVLAASAGGGPEVSSVR